MEGSPNVYSLTNDDSTEEMKASVDVTTYHAVDQAQIDIKYGDKECENEYEHMQMDITMVEGCDTLSL